MDPLLGVALGAVIVYLIISDSVDPASANPAGGSYFQRAQSILNKAAANGKSGQTGQSGGQSGQSANPSPFVPTAPRSVTRDPGLTAKDAIRNQTLSQDINLGAATGALALTAGGTPVPAAALNPLADAGFLAVQGTSRAVQATGQLVAQGRVNPINPGFQDGQAGGSFNSLTGKAGSLLTDIGAQIGKLGGVGAIGGSVVGTAALSGFRQANDKQRKTILGQAALSGVQTAEAAIPLVGGGISALTGQLAKTGEGKRVVAEAGRGLFRGYEAQKSFVGGQFSTGFKTLFGGSTHKERVKSFLQSQNGPPETTQNSTKLAAADKAVQTANLNAAAAAKSGNAQTIAATPGAAGFVPGLQVQAAAVKSGSYGFIPKNSAQDKEFMLARSAIEAKYANITADKLGERNNALMALNAQFVQKYGA